MFMKIINHEIHETHKKIQNFSSTFVSFVCFVVKIYGFGGLNDNSITKKL